MFGLRCRTDLIRRITQVEYPAISRIMPNEWTISQINWPVGIDSGESSHSRKRLLSECAIWAGFKSKCGRRSGDRRPAMRISCAATSRRGLFLSGTPMADDIELLGVLRRHGVPFIIIGGHAVNFHGYGRVTEDTDVVWLRSPQAELILFRALTELDAHYIGKDIDPATGIERTYPVTHVFIRSSPLMMLTTRFGFLDLFDHLPGLPSEDPANLLATSVESEGLRYASLDRLREMKRAADRPKDRLDLENLPD